jgi:hypothetical protein
MRESLGAAARKKRLKARTASLPAPLRQVNATAGAPERRHIAGLRPSNCPQRRHAGTPAEELADSAGEMPGLRTRNLSIPVPQPRRLPLQASRTSLCGLLAPVFLPLLPFASPVLVAGLLPVHPMCTRCAYGEITVKLPRRGLAGLSAAPIRPWRCLTEDFGRQTGGLPRHGE